MSFKVCNICNKRKEISEFYARYSKCKRCMKPEKDAAYQRNKIRQKEQAKERYYLKKDEIFGQKKEYIANNQDKIREQRRRSYEKHRAKILEEKRQYFKRNAGLLNFKKSVKRVGSAMPPWADDDMKKAMIQIYSMAAEMTESTGVSYTVDHIIPIKGVGVRGLHVPWNLQILTRSENSKKRNKIIT